MKPVTKKQIEEVLESFLEGFATDTTYDEAIHEDNIPAVAEKILELFKGESDET